MSGPLPHREGVVAALQRGMSAVARAGRHLVPRSASRPDDTSASPADFDAYVKRQPWLDRRIPEAWAMRLDRSLEREAQVAAVVHVFYPELLPELISNLAAIPVPFDLYMTNAVGTDLEVDTTRMPQLGRFVPVPVENRGRDLWPLAQLVNASLLDPYTLIVKVHTKRSAWRDTHERLAGSGASWRTHLLADLVGEAENVRFILDAFDASPELGMVTADGSALGPEFWGQNVAVAATLLKRMELELRPNDLTFAAGSMYWARGALVRRLRSLHLSSEDFEEEQGQIDGTTAHALERVIGWLAWDSGMRIAERSQLPRPRP